MLNQSDGLTFGQNIADTVLPDTYAGPEAYPSGDGWVVSRSGDSLHNSYIRINATGRHEIIFEVEDNADYPGNQVDVRYSGLIQYYSVGTHRITSDLGSNIRFMAPATHSVKVTIISCRKLNGIHATQTVGAKRPILARMPSVGRRNLLDSSVMEGNWWNKYAGITISSGIARFKLVTQASGQSAPRTSPNHFYVPNGGQLTGTVLLDANQSTDGRPFSMFVGSGGSHRVSIWFTVAGETISITAYGGSSIGWDRVSHSLEDLGGGIYKARITAVNNTGAPYNATLGFWGDGQSNGSLAFRDPQMELGGEATPYQRVGNPYDVTEAGQTSYDYLVFDGVDDFMQTPALTYSDTDEMSVFAGARKRGGNGNQVVAELGDDVGFSDSNVRPVDPLGTGEFSYFTSSKIIDSTYDLAFDSASQPTGMVMSGQADLSDQDAILRVNGEETATYGQNQSGGTYGSYPLFIGARGGTEMFFKGDLFSLIVVGKTVDADTTGKVEDSISKKVG
jgi:hypothetical protein